MATTYFQNQGQWVDFTCLNVSTGQPITSLTPSQMLVYYKQNNSLVFAQIPFWELAGTGTGSATNFVYTLANLPVTTFSIKVSAGSVSGTDNGAGSITGTGISGTINYATGVLNITFTTAPTSGTPINVTYFSTSASLVQVTSPASPLPGQNWISYGNGVYSVYVPSTLLGTLGLFLYTVLPSNSGLQNFTPVNNEGLVTTAPDDFVPLLNSISTSVNTINTNLTAVQSQLSSFVVSTGTSFTNITNNLTTVQTSLNQIQTQLQTISQFSFPFLSANVTTS